MTTKRLLTGAAIGLVAGFASGYVGVGGGFLMVPLFISLLGITMKKASGTSLIAVVILAIPGVITQTLHGNVDFVAGIAMAIGSIPGRTYWSVAHPLYSRAENAVFIRVFPAVCRYYSSYQRTERFRCMKVEL